MKKHSVYLGVLEHLLQALLHQLELAGLDAAVGQQHATKLSLRDSAVHWVVPVKLQSGEGRGGDKNRNEGDRERHKVGKSE